MNTEKPQVAPVKTGPKVPDWMTVSAESVTVKLTVPSSFNGVKSDTITLRSPSLKDVRNCQKAHPNDEEAVDLMLFASLAEVGTSDMEGLKLKDYLRVQTAYFRVVAEDSI